MITRAFHAWEARLASVSTDRVVRPFEWGLDWLDGDHADAPTPREAIRAWGDRAVADSTAFFTPAPTSDYEHVAGPGGGDSTTLRFPSALVTPHPENNTVVARYFPAPATRRGGRAAARRAVVVLPQWNSDAGGHVGLCRLLARTGVSALRLSLPYHDARRPPELHRADYLLSANIGRTLQVCRQGVLDARRAIWWLHGQGYDRIGLLGTSLGSCLATLTACHEPLVTAQALNHVSPYFADVVWRGLSTRHVRAGLEGHIDLDDLREAWRPISPWTYIDRAARLKTLLVYARYDLTFPLDLSRMLIDEFRQRGLPHEVAMLPCGHYSTGVAPFKYLDGYYLQRFIDRNL
ncbi:MAG: alpha/beta hydrolase family protein [Vicinamibacterales bacterium]|nr:alpha/beta hydrolase family protein [Vicinamibacterales bacterium]